MRTVGDGWMVGLDDPVVLFQPWRFDSILFYSILFYSILFYSILFYSKVQGKESAIPETTFQEMEGFNGWNIFLLAVVC